MNFDDNFLTEVELSNIPADKKAALLKKNKEELEIIISSNFL